MTTRSSVEPSETAPRKSTSMMRPSPSRRRFLAALCTVITADSSSEGNTGAASVIDEPVVEGLALSPGVSVDRLQAVKQTKLVRMMKEKRNGNLELTERKIILPATSPPARRLGPLDLRLQRWKKLSAAMEQQPSQFQSTLRRQRWNDVGPSVERIFRWDH